MNTGSRRIAWNTLATYARSLAAAALALFSGRWVLAALGESDYGLYNLVGAIIVFVTFLSTVMAGSAARFFAVAIGADDSAEVRSWFRASLTIHLGLGVGLVALGIPVGEFAVRHFLTIPAERIGACLAVFRVSLVSAFLGIVSVPFASMFNARQRMGELALWGLVQSFLMFALAAALATTSGDRLVFYAVWSVAIMGAVQLAQILRAMRRFPECSLSRMPPLESGKVRELFAFTGFVLVDNVGALLRNQGTAILLNLYFGPAVNAAYGIANQVSAQTSQFSGSLLGAFAPEINASEGRGDRARMLRLADRASRYGTLLMLVFAVPLMIEMPYVLRLWLGSPPEHTTALCRWILAMFLIDRMTTGNLFAVLAGGKIAAYQATVGLLQVMALPLAWVLLAMGWAPHWVGGAFVATSSAIAVGRVEWSRRLFGVRPAAWLRDVLMPCLAVVAAAALFAWLPSLWMESSLVRLVLASFASGVASLVSFWRFASGPEEKAVFAKLASRFGVAGNNGETGEDAGR